MEKFYTVFNIKHLKRLGIAIVFFLALLPFKSYGQPSDSTIFDTKGTDFWLTFMPNFHQSTPYTQDSLFIFINADEVTKGVIEYRDSSGRSFSVPFSITDPAKMFTFGIPYKDVANDQPANELIGISNDDHRILTRNQDEQIAKQSFHITSEKEVTVYALSQAVTTSDAFLVLPTDVIGYDYYVMAYNNDGSGTTTNWTPSEFAIVASSDNTTLTISPTAPTFSNGSIQQTVQMKKGDVYLVQALLDGSDRYKFIDLTGSYIHSNKPVAVFGGHQRAVVPVNYPFGSPSRDCLIEQMPPVKTWGKNAFLIPYSQPDDISRANDLFRIMAAYNNTIVYINNVKTATLNAGEFFEGPLISAALVTANNPILVAQFKRTAANTSTVSDPFMMIIPPKEQFKENYRVINCQIWQSGLTVYKEQWIIVVSQKASVGSVRIDGRPVTTPFTNIPNSEYAFANIRTTDGVHYVEAKDRIGVYVYGYGSANSYGYVGGMSMKPLDLKPPVIAFDDSCFSVKGVVTDSSISDSRVSEVLSPQDSRENTNVDIEKFTPYPNSVKFIGKLIDNKKDGQFIITAKDSVGLVTSDTIQIPGFTVSVKGQEATGAIIKTNDTCKINKKNCFSVDITNYGKFRQKINRIYVKNASIFSVQPPIKDTLDPGETRTINVCFFASKDTVYKDSLFIENECIRNCLVAYEITAVADRKDPVINIANSDCDSIMTITITDSTFTDDGIKQIKIKDSVNCAISYDTVDPRLTRLSLKIINPFEDARYSIEATDSSGHRSVKGDTIPGFTLSLPDLDPNSGILNQGTVKMSSTKCDTVKLHNFGKHILTLNAFMKRNIMFSFPPSQIISIKPGKDTIIVVCFQPLDGTGATLRDTLRFSNIGCSHKDIYLLGVGSPIDLEGNAACNVPIKLTSIKYPVQNFIEQYPNPSQSDVKLKFGVAEDGTTRITVYDMLGNLKKVLIEGNYNTGVYEYNYSVSDLPAGIYMYDLLTNGKRTSSYFIIEK